MARRLQNRRPWPLKWLQALCGLALVFSATINAFSVNNEFLPVEEAYQVMVGDTGKQLQMNWSIADGYYLYQHQFKAIAQNGDTAIELPLSFSSGKKKYDEYFEKELEVYYFNASNIAQLPDIKPPYELVIKSQGCADAGLCYPPRKQYFNLNTSGTFEEGKRSQYPSAPKPMKLSAKQAPDAAPLSKESSTKNTPSNNLSSNTPAPLQTENNLLKVLAFALLGGLVLNLMPCVFPVLSLKALSFASANQDGHAHHLHGWSYTAGVIGSFLVAAGVILVARATGESLGWGFQLQRPGFVALMVYLFFVMGLSLSGMVNFGTSLMGFGQSLTQGQGLKSSFFTGVLAALVASPCTAPFMATALGYALTQPAIISLIVFTCLGFGMALPFLLLSYSPNLANHLPRPGAWMETLKQFLAFPLYITCVWLLWVLGKQASPLGTAAITLGAIALAFAIWILGIQPKQTSTRFFVRSTAAACVMIAAYLAYDVGSVQKREAHWQTYSPQALAELRASSKPVFVDLTADWCLTCKFNERVALNTDKVKLLSEKLGITMLQGDWTNQDPDISKLLNQYGRNGVPLYLMYPKDPSAQVKVLPQILTESTVIAAMEDAAQ